MRPVTAKAQQKAENANGGQECREGSGSPGNSVPRIEIGAVHRAKAPGWNVVGDCKTSLVLPQ